MATAYLQCPLTGTGDPGSATTPPDPIEPSIASLVDAYVVMPDSDQFPNLPSIPAGQCVVLASASDLTAAEAADGVIVVDGTPYVGYGSIAE